MKKMIVILLLVCVALGGAVGYLHSRSAGVPAAPTVPEAEAAETAAPAAEAAEEPAANAAADGGLQMEQMEYQTMDLPRLYALHEPGETVLALNGKPESWGDYFYFLASQINSVEKMLVRLYANYGAELLWSDQAEQGVSYADLAVNGTEKAMRQLAAIEGFARENGVELTEADRQALAEKLASDMELTCGEGAAEEAFTAYLASRHMSRELYDRINAANLLYREGFRRLYGERGETLADEAALRFLEEGGYLSAAHILLLTENPATGEALEEAIVAEKAAEAQRLAEELQAIEDPAELLERFRQLKEEYCEDTGKALYPDGYTFTPHTMAAEFEAACKELEPYGVSDPVQSRYGYHVILRLPPDAEALLYTAEGDPVTARCAAANAEYDGQLQAYAESLEAEYADGFEKPDLLDYVKG